MVEHGAVNLRNNLGHTPLYDFYSNSRPEIADYLISKGATISEEKKEALAEAKLLAEPHNFWKIKKPEISNQEEEALESKVDTEAKELREEKPSVALEDAQTSENTGPKTPITSMKR